MHIEVNRLVAVLSSDGEVQVTREMAQEIAETYFENEHINTVKADLHEKLARDVAGSWEQICRELQKYRHMSAGHCRSAAVL